MAEIVTLSNVISEYSLNSLLIVLIKKKFTSKIIIITDKIKIIIIVKGQISGTMFFPVEFLY